MASVLKCMTPQQSNNHIPQFDGKNPPLKKFSQEVANGPVCITEATESGFIKVVLRKLKGVLREIRKKTSGHVKSVRDNAFPSIAGRLW